jgi:hypothetical protein
VHQPHDRQVDGLPANIGLADAGKVFPDDIPGAVQVGIDLVSALSAPKDGLRRPIAAMHMPTLAATLAGVSGTDGLHDRADGLGFVGDKASKLGIAPPVMATPLAPTSLLGARADLGQVLDHDHATRSRALDNPLGENVVAIPPKQSLSAAHFLQMPLGRFRAFGLEFALEPEIPRFNLLPFSLPEELGVGCNSRPVDAEIDTNNATGRNEFRRLDLNDQMQPPTGRSAQQVGGSKTGSFVDPPPGLAVRGERQLDPTDHRGKSDDTLIFLDAEAALVIPDHSAFETRRRDFLAFLLQGKGRAKRLCRLHPGRDNKLRGQVGMRLAQVGIRRLMQRDAVLFLALPAKCGNRIEALSRRRQRCRQDRVLLGGQLKSDAHCALHTPFMEEISVLCNVLARPKAAFPLSRKRDSLHAEVLMNAMEFMREAGGDARALDKPSMVTRVRDDVRRG